MALRTSLAVSTLTLGLLGIVGPVDAQDSAFLAVVRELATTRVGLAKSGDRMKAALAEWDRQIARLQSGADTIEGHITLGLAYRQRGRLNQAIREFDAAIALQPALALSSDIHLFRALTSEAAGNLEDAGRSYQTAWAYHPASPGKAYLALRRAPNLDADGAVGARGALLGAYTRILAGSYSAEAPIFPTLDAVPDTFSAAPIAGEGRLARVFALLAGGKLDEATAALGDSSPAPAATESARARIARAGIAEREGRLADARRDYSAAIEGTLAGRYALYVGIARLAQVKGDVDGAIDAFDHAARLNPNDPLLRRELSAALVSAGRFDDAFAELMAALLVTPNDAEVLAAVGQLFLDTDRAGDAIAPLRRALVLKADRYATHYALAVALSRAGQADDAAREFEQFDRLSRQALEGRRRAVAGQAGLDGSKR